MKPVAASVVLLGLAGCGSGDETTSYRLVPVTGNVTLNNKPLGGATITFVPDQANKPSTPGGDTTGPDGNYKAMFRNRSGLAPGKYTVSVTPPASNLHDNESLKNDPHMAALAAGHDTKRLPGKTGGATALGKNEWPVEIPDGGGTFDFDAKASAAAAPAAAPAEAKKK